MSECSVSSYHPLPYVLLVSGTEQRGNNNLTLIVILIEVQESLVIIHVLIHNPLRGRKGGRVPSTAWCSDNPPSCVLSGSNCCQDQVWARLFHGWSVAEGGRGGGTGAPGGWERVGADKTRLGTKSNWSGRHNRLHINPDFGVTVLPTLGRVHTHTHTHTSIVEPLSKLSPPVSFDVNKTATLHHPHRLRNIYNFQLFTRHHPSSSSLRARSRNTAGKSLHTHNYSLVLWSISYNFYTEMSPGGLEK